MSSSLLDASEGIFEVRVRPGPHTPEMLEAAKESRKRLRKIFGDSLIESELK